jgi:hypothetical protein
MSSGPTLQIGGGGDLSSDIGAMEITNIDDFDLGLLGNQRKISGTPPASTPNMRASDGVEFVSLEDTQVSYNVKPVPVSDTIKILRDAPVPPREPSFVLNDGPSAFASVPAATATAPATAGAAGAAATTGAATAKSWFSFPSMSSAAPSSADSGGGILGGISSLFGGGGGSSSSESRASDRAPEFNPSLEFLSPEQESAKKSEGLTMLERMDRKGIGGSKMTSANTLDEINAEVAKRKDSKGLEASLRFQRSMMTTVTSGMEFLNSRYDPLGVHLDGWSEQVNENVEDYDEIFEELYDKYKDKSKVAPEVRLIMSLGLSAAMCHITNTMFKSKMPGMDDILRNNPGLKQQFAQAAAREVGPGFGNFMGLGGQRPMASAPPPARQPPPPSQSYPPMSSQEIPNYGMDAPMGGMRGPPAQTMDPRGPPAPVTVRREMRGPTGVDDILQKLQAAEQRAERTVERVVERRMDSDDGGSVGSAYTTETMRRNGISASANRKRRVAQPTGSTLTLNV